jgi:Fe2+ or Zn2+ uptake regulation protein
MITDSYVATAVRRLQESSHRVTPGRLRVLHALAAAERGLTLQALQGLLAVGGKPLDRMTLYRTLELLENQGLVHRLAFTGEYLRCQLGGSGCHHHLVCRRCGLVQEVHCLGMAAVERAAAATNHFRIGYHLVEFVGLCPQCRC